MNSISLNFTPLDTKKAYFAGGCFWGVEYFFNKQEGVLDALSGFMGGHTLNPTYQDICYKDTGHLEVVEVLYDSKKISYENLTKLFFEIHDPTQRDGQGPDIGSQYLSAVFVCNEEEKKVVDKLSEELRKSSLHVVTKVLKKQEFYPAEDYHQYYYKKTGKMPYCHHYTKRFNQV